MCGEGRIRTDFVAAGWAFGNVAFAGGGAGEEGVQGGCNGEEGREDCEGFHFGYVGGKL